MRQISQCVNPKLTEIIQSALKLKALQSEVFELLPKHLREYFIVGSFHQGCLVLMTSDSTWASQLRFYLPELRDELRKAGIYQLASIRIHILAEPLTHQKTKPTYLSLSSSACESILALSAQCEYEPLKEALKQLAIRSKSPTMLKQLRLE